MEAIAINGSPRKNRNTATLLKKALDGAASKGARTTLIHLYDLEFKGYCSCFACKRKTGSHIGYCAKRDGLTDVLMQVMESDILLLGSPIYLGNVTGAMRSFMERLLFPVLSYDRAEKKIFTGKIQTGFIYTMGVPKERIEAFGYPYIFEGDKHFLQLLNGHHQELISADSYQFDDYSRYAASVFDVGHKIKVRQEQFPIDCENAFAMGERAAIDARS